jgi:ribosomal protein L37AE/L43A
MFQRPVYMPQRHTDTREGQFANAHEPGCCPDCRSRIHYTEKNGDWKCADCATKFRPPNNPSRLSRELREAIAADSVEYHEGGGRFDIGKDRKGNLYTRVAA